MSSLVNILIKSNQNIHPQFYVRIWIMVQQIVLVMVAFGMSKTIDIAVITTMMILMQENYAVPVNQMVI